MTDNGSAHVFRGLNGPDCPQAKEKAAAFIRSHGQYPMKQVGTDEIGFAVYQLKP